MRIDTELPLTRFILVRGNFIATLFLQLLQLFREFRETFVEFVNTTSRIYQFHFARKERV